MAIPLIARLRTGIRPLFLKARRSYFRLFWGMDIGNAVQISLSAKLDKTNPRGVHIGDETIVTFGATILTHDFVKRRHLDTRIGKRCFIGANSIIIAGIEIGDHCIVGAGSVVVNHVPARSVVVGNPARVVATGIDTGPYGVRLVTPPA